MLPWLRHVPQGASSDARIYIEMFGPYDDVTTGEVRLVNMDTHQKSFTRNALDLFIVSHGRTHAWTAFAVSLVRGRVCFSFFRLPSVLLHLLHIKRCSAHLM